MCEFKVIRDLKIGAEIYDEMYNRIIEEDIEEQDEYEIEDFDEFLLYNGNSENSLDLLSDGNKYYINRIVDEWDDIIDTLYACNKLEDLSPKDMKKRKITDLFLHQVCIDVIGDFVEKLNNEE
jgi:hypothetical protein